MLSIAFGILEMISYTEEVSITSKYHFLLFVGPYCSFGLYCGRKEDCRSIISHDQHISHERGLGTRKEALPVSLSAPIEG